MKKFKSYLLAVAMISLFFVSCSNSSGSSGSSDKEKDPTTNTDPQTPDDTVTLDKTFTGTTLRYLEAGTDGSFGDKKTYVLYGDWPQTKKADSVTIDKSIKVEIGYFTYYKGSDNGWYAQPYDNFEDYYKVEPIKWVILTENYNDEGKKLLFSEVPFNSLVYYNYSADRTDSQNKIIKWNNYEHSRIRAYLNGLGFMIKTGETEEITTENTYKDKGAYQTAFTKEIRDQILETRIETTITRDMSTAEKILTNEKLFLLDKNEVDTLIGHGTQARKRKLTDYVRRISSYNDNDFIWTLRGISETSLTNKYQMVDYIDQDGAIKELQGLSIGGCIFPVMCIK